MMWFLIIYVLSVICAYFSDRFAYKKYNITPTPHFWVIPLVNTIFAIISIIYLSKDNPSDYFKSKWDK